MQLHLRRVVDLETLFMYWDTKCSWYTLCTLYLYKKTIRINQRTGFRDEYGFQFINTLLWLMMRDTQQAYT